jgi:endonuclease/exonuclease/phosphatase family metal-dependent hydrolase
MKKTYCLSLLLFFLMPQASVSASTTPIHAMTFNIYNRPIYVSKRVQSALSFIRDNPSDIIALQEVAQWCGGQDPSETLAKALGYPHKRFWLEQGLLRNTGLALLTRFPILDSGVEYFQKNRFWDQKGFLYATVQLPDTLLLIINVHMSSAEGGPIKESQFQQLLTFIQKHPNPLPTLLIGDFNEPTHTPLFQNFIQQLHAQDIVPLIQKHTPHTATWASAYGRTCQHPKAQQLDTLLLVPTSNTASLWIDGQILQPHTQPLPSDHCPVIGSFELKKTP